MKSDNLSPGKIAFTYIGTVIGAGFASGQEIFQFFSTFGINGLLGIFVTVILYSVFGYIIMDLGRQLNSFSHREIIYFASGKHIGRIIDSIITVFLFGSMITMFAGAGALLKQQLEISSMWGSLLMGILTAFTLLSGMNGIINSMSILVPVLLFLIIGIGILSIWVTPIPLYVINITLSPSSLIHNWVLGAVLYFSSNIIMAISVLAPLGVNGGNKKAIQKGSMLAGISLGICAIVITLCLWGAIEKIIYLEMPMLYVAGRLHPILQLIYILVLFISIYTTAIGCSYGFISRIALKDCRGSQFIIIGFICFALLLSRIGFSNLVKYLYPIQGYAGLILLLYLLWGKIKLTIKNRPR